MVTFLGIQHHMVFMEPFQNDQEIRIKVQFFLNQALSCKIWSIIMSNGKLYCLLKKKYII